jgi:ABC-2 type transport system permease protein
VIIHSDKLRWLFWLRWKMFLRDFTRGSGRVSLIIGRIFLLLFGVVVGGSIALVSFLGYRFLAPPANAEVLFIVLSVIYLIWMALPLMEFNINEGLDPSKLSLFPLTRAERMVSLVISTVLDLPMVGLFLVLAGVVAGWSTSIPLALISLLTMLIFYVQLVSISQLVLAALMRTLQSRRFRDVFTVVFIILASSSGILCQFLFRGIATESFFGFLKSAAFSPYLQWFPPGMAARTIQQASLGNWGMSLAWLLALIAATFLVLYAWQILVERAMQTPESAAQVSTVRRRTETEAEKAAGSLLARLLPGQVLAIAVKDFKFFRRDPQIQGMLLQSLITIVLLSLYVVYNSIQSGRDAGSFISFIGPWAMMVAPLFMMISLYTLSYNLLGFERQGLTALFLFPVQPRHILWGKNLPIFIMGLVEVLILVLLLAFLSHAWQYALPSLTVGLAGIAVILGCGNFTSVFMPQRMKPAFRGFQSSANLSAERGCLRAFLSMLAFYATVIILAPVELALILPVVLNAQWFWIISIPLSLLYAFGIYYGITALVAPRILQRVPEILAVVVKE